MDETVRKGIAIALAQVEAANRHNFAASAAFMAPAFRLVVNGVTLGPEEAAQSGQVFVDLVAAAPDTALRVHWLDGTGNRLVHQFSFGGTFTREAGPFKATGERFELHACTLMEHDGEKLTALWRNLDEGEMGRQLAGRGTLCGPAPAEREGGSFPWGPERRAMEERGERIVREMFAAESGQDVGAFLAAYHDPIAVIVAGHRVEFPHEVGRAMAAGWSATRPRRELHDVLPIGDRVAVRFTLHWTPEGKAEESTHGCYVIEHDGRRITREWRYYADYERVLPGVYQRLAAS